MEEGEKGLSRSIARADYLLKLDELPESELAGAVSAFLAQPSHEITVQRKKGERVVDVRQVVDEIRVATDEDRDRLPEALRQGLPETTLFLRLRLDLEHSLKPVEVLRSVLGQPERELRPIDLIRLGLWDVQNDQLRPSLGESTAVSAA